MVAMLSILLLILASGTAVFLALGITATSLLLNDGHALAGVAQILVDRLNSQTLTAIPFFVTAATIMRRGGMATALVKAADAWIGDVSGGIAVMAVVVAALFASISGSSTATALALGTILLPAMAQRGYTPRFNAGLVGGSATLGILLPPSIALIIYGLVAEIPVPKLFLAGLVPALLQGILFVGWTLFTTRSMPLVPSQSGLNIREKFKLSVDVIPALLVPFVALGGIYSGLVTLSEASALAALVAILVCLLKGSCRGRELIVWIGDGFMASTVILILVGMAVLLSHWIILSGISDQLIAFLKDSDVTPLQFLLTMNLVMFALGMFLEIISVILITTPLVLPLLSPLGIDPIHYGIIVIVNMELAALTPPVGLNLYVMKSVSGLILTDVLRGFLPFVLLLALLLVAVTALPALSLWLPSAW